MAGKAIFTTHFCQTLPERVIISQTNIGTVLQVTLGKCVRNPALLYNCPVVDRSFTDYFAKLDCNHCLVNVHILDS